MRPKDIKRLALPTPELSLAEARKKWEHEYIPREDYGTLVNRDALGTLDGEFKFLYLRGHLFPQGYSNFYEQLQSLPFKSCKYTQRRALRGSGGGEIMLGWFLDRNSTRPRLTVKTLDHHHVYDEVVGDSQILIGWAIADFMPDHWKEALARAKQNGKHLIDRAKNLDLNRCSDDLYPLFSTVTINRNTTCKAHIDAKNARGYACLTTYGNFRGGELCFPHLGVAFDVRPGDLLIADTNGELHGNRR